MGGKGSDKVCGGLSFIASVEPGELKEYKVVLKRPSQLNDKIKLDPTPAKIFVCDEVGKCQTQQRQLC